MDCDFYLTVIFMKGINDQKVLFRAVEEVEVKPFELSFQGIA